MREIQRAIGEFGCRGKTGAGQKFRHTAIRNRLIRDFLDRNDVLEVLRASYIAMACMSSNPRVVLDEASQIVKDARRTYVESLFPYIKKERSSEKSYEDYSEYFDELDAIEAAKNKADVGTEPHK